MAMLVNELYQRLPCRRTNGKSMITRAQFSRLFYPLLITQSKDCVWLDSVLEVPANRHLLDCLVHNATKNGKPFSIQVLKRLAAQGFVQLAYPQGALANRSRPLRNYRFGQLAVQALQHAVAMRKSGFVIHRVWLA